MPRARLHATNADRQRAYRTRKAAYRKRLMSITKPPEWFTPAYLVDAARAVLGTIDLDPASSDEAQEVVRATRYFTRETDGLLTPWPAGARTWMNPPYSRGVIAQFVERARKHDGPTVLLTNNQTDSRWAQVSRARRRYSARGAARSGCMGATSRCRSIHEGVRVNGPRGGPVKRWWIRRAVGNISLRAS